MSSDVMKILKLLNKLRARELQARTVDWHWLRFMKSARLYSRSYISYLFRSPANSLFRMSWSASHVTKLYSIIRFRSLDLRACKTSSDYTFSKNKVTLMQLFMHIFYTNPVLSFCNVPNNILHVIVSQKC